VGFRSSARSESAVPLIFDQILSAKAIGGMMRKKKGKSIHKTKTKTKTKSKKKLARLPKRIRSKASSRKKKPVRSEGRTARVLAVEVTEVEVIANIEHDFVDDAEGAMRDPLDEHFPPDYGGSE
jgi:hypothetical protein